MRSWCPLSASLGARSNPPDSDADYACQRGQLRTRNELRTTLQSLWGQWRTPTGPPRTRGGQGRGGGRRGGRGGSGGG
ncbi:hypothetical protein B0H14DRAFT_3168102, partial [Mycena olivaceomarginata]